MAFCNKCGNEIGAGAAFCAKCGGHAGSAAVTAGSAVGTPYTVTPNGPKSRKWLWIALGCAAAAIIAVTCILVFVVFQEKIFGGPEKKVEALLQAMSDKDVDAYLAVIDPEGLLEFKDAYGLDSRGLRESVRDGWTYESMEFSGITMETEMAQDGKSATVTITGGEVTTVSEGEKTVEDAADDEREFNLVVRDGKWYVDEQILGGSGSPEQTVRDFMQAMEDKDIDGFLAVIDPEGLETLKQMIGLDDAGFKEAMSEDVMSESIKFEDIEMTTEMAADGKSATVTITEGTVTTVEDGEETVEDAAAEEGGPPEFTLILGDDGRWYLDLFGML